MDTSAKTTSHNLFGTQYKLPVAIAPTGLNGLITPEGDQMIARAAAAHGIPFILSTAANCSMKQIIEITGVAPWFQLYVINKTTAFGLIDQVEKLGCKVLIVTVDVPVSGNRLRDRRNGFTMPFKPTLPMLIDCIRYPAWGLKQLNAAQKLRFPILNSGPLYSSRENPLFSRSFDDSLCWKDIIEIRNRWKGILILKGILHPEDAIQANNIGVDGIVVSNHGGRQLESAPTSLEMLPHISAAVKNKMVILLDGGVRCGEDIIKSIALGADGVLTGRLPLYGLAARGLDGVSQVLSMLQREILTAMSLIGCTTINDIKHTGLIKYTSHQIFSLK
jgi:(S)-mandelate dehydrogenase